MATVDPSYFDFGARLQQGINQGRLQKIAEEDRALAMQDRGYLMQKNKAIDEERRAENQYTQHQREAQTLLNITEALKKIPRQKRKDAVNKWSVSSPIVANAAKMLPPEYDYDDESLNEASNIFSAAVGGFQQGQAVQSVEMDENGNLFIIDRSGGIKQAINPQTGKPIVGRKPGAQVSGKRIVQGVDEQGNPAYQVVDLSAGEQPTIKPTPDTRATQTTEAERKAAGFYDRMLNASQILNQMETKGYTPSMRDLYTSGQGLLNFLATQEGQNYRQAQENWVRANLRKESGAVIGEDEMTKEISNYFPQAGDKPDVIEQKRKNRSVVENNMLREAGRAYSPQNPPKEKKYSVGQVIDVGGKRYRVIGGDMSDPDVEELK